jgi:hypothetical protein
MKQRFKQFILEKYIHYIDTVKDQDNYDTDDENKINNKDKKNMDLKKIKYSFNLIKYLQQANAGDR